MKVQAELYPIVHVRCPHLIQNRTGLRECEAIVHLSPEWQLTDETSYRFIGQCPTCGNDLEYRSDGRS